MTEPICYTSAEEKRRLFPSRTIPGVYNVAAAGVDDPVLRAWLVDTGIAAEPHGLAQLIGLHELARAGSYRRPLAWNCDPLQTVAATLISGGDCDQWASVLLAALAALGYKARLVTFGDRGDRFQHVAVTAKFDGRWYLLDAKGDDRGLEFDRLDTGYAVFESWEPPPAYARLQ